jgi:hypothetical protein
MLSYNQILMGDLVEEVTYRMTNFRSDFNTDYFTIAHLANHAINEIMSKSLPYKDWAYISTLPIADATLLPREFLKVVRVMLSHPTTGDNYEARYSTPMEVHSVTNTTIGMVHNLAYQIQPVYTLWGRLDNGVPYLPSELFIYLYPQNMTGFMDCYVSLPFNYNDNYQIPIPYEFLEGVISGTLFRLLQKIGMSKEASLVYSMIEQERIKAIQILQEKKKTEVMNLDNFSLPVPPNAPVPPPFNQPKRR